MAGGTLKIKVKIQDKAKVKKYLEKAAKCLSDENLDKALRKGAWVYEEGMKKRVTKDTRKLERSIKARKASVNGKPGYEIMPGRDIINPYAIQQERGAKAMNGYRGDGYMRFKGKRGWARVKEIKGVYYVRRTWEEDTDKAYKAFKEELFKNWPS